MSSVGSRLSAAQLSRETRADSCTLRELPKHHQKILRKLGIVPVNMVAAAETFGSKTLKRKIKRREKTESLNRALEDTLFLGRAHSLGWRRQQVEMLGWALMVNALTMARHRTAENIEAAA